MAKYRYRSPEELRSYDFYKLGVLLILLVLLGFLLGRGRWEGASIAATPGVVTTPSGFTMKSGLNAFRSANDLGELTVYGTSSGDQVELLADGVVIATATPDANERWGITHSPYTGLAGKNLILREQPRGAQLPIEAFDMARIPGDFDFTGDFEIVQDEVNDSRFFADFQGLTRGGEFVRVTLDGVETAMLDSSGVWQWRAPIESVQGKLVEAQRYSADRQPVGGKMMLMEPPSAEEVRQFQFTLATPAVGETKPTGVTDFKGTAAPGSVILVYVDKWVVAKAIADADGKWISRARIKSAGVNRNVRAVTVPFRGVAAQTSNINTVTFNKVQ